MTKEEIKRAELVREEIRRTLNQMLEEEYAAIIKETEEGNTLLSIGQRDMLMAKSRNLIEGTENNTGTTQERG